MKDFLEALSLALALYFSILITIEIVTFWIRLVLFSTKTVVSLEITWKTIAAVIFWSTFYFLRHQV